MPKRSPQERRKWNILCYRKLGRIAASSPTKNGRTTKSTTVGTTGELESTTTNGSRKTETKSTTH
jgi:hypothetical protein